MLSHWACLSLVCLPIYSSYLLLSQFLDDVYPESTPPKLGILGGAGTYATVGARMFYPGKKAKNVGFVVHTGSDFTRSTRDEIDSWKSGIHFIDTPKRETTRGKNVYSDGIRGRSIQKCRNRRL